MITKWSIASDGTAHGTTISYDGKILGDITSLSIDVACGSFTIGQISFITRLEDVKVKDFNAEIRDYVNAELTKFMKAKNVF